jgi:hypothetical protein
MSRAKRQQKASPDRPNVNYVNFKVHHKIYDVWYNIDHPSLSTNFTFRSIS